VLGDLCGPGGSISLGFRMPLIRIDDREIEAPAGESLLRVALNHGIYIPYYCYHPSLSVVGQCRMCLVEVKGAPKPLTACSTAIVSLPPDKKIDGKYDMVVDTRSAVTKTAQRAILEFLLLNHPLDCPICDQAGECELQRYSYEYGSAGSRFDFEKLHFPKRVDLGPHVVFDAERCIKCTRCIRFCEEISGTGELTLTERGAHTMVDTFPGRKLDNPYSVCTVDICPVGALTSKEFRFKERVWFLSSANSVCPECSRGCAVRYDTYKGEVLRLVPRNNPKVNGPWMCDYGRLLSERLRDVETKDRPGLRGEKGWAFFTVDAFWPAFAERAAKTDFSGAALLLSGRMTLEEMSAFRRLSGARFGGAAGIAPRVVSGVDDALLIRRERRPNLEGARRLGIAVPAEGAAPAQLLKGRKAALIVREDPVGDAVGTAKREVVAALEAMEFVVVADHAFTETARYAHAFVPLAAWHEMEGTTVNFQGHLQKTARVLMPPKNRRPFYEAVSHWLTALGEEAPEPTFAAWFAEVKRLLPELADRQVRDLLPDGVRLTEEGGA